MFKITFCEIWHLFSQALIRNFLWCHSYLQELIASITLEKWKKNAILFKFFWNKVFVHWQLKLLNFLMDSILIVMSSRMNTKSHQRARPLGLNPHLDHKMGVQAMIQIHYMVRLSPHPLMAHTLQLKWICIWLLHFSYSEDEFSLTALFTNSRTLKFKTAAFKTVFRCRQSKLRSQTTNLVTQEHTKQIEIQQSQTMTFWTRWSRPLFPKSSSKMILSEGTEKCKRQLAFEL